MKKKKTLVRELCTIVAAGLITLGVNSVGSVAFSDELHNVNVDTSNIERSYVFDSYNDILEADITTGVTAPYLMSVVGRISDDRLTTSTIDYLSQYSGFTVGNEIILNFRNLTIQNALSVGNGSVVNNLGSVTFNNVSLIGNKVSNPTAAVYGGAIYNAGDMTFSGNLLNNSVESTESKNGGAIYTSTDMKLLADGNDYLISGNKVTTDGVTKSQAIYVGDIDSTLTIEAKNGGSWQINDIIDGENERISGTYYRYNVDITGDMNSVVTLKNDIKNADVTIKDVNLYISNNTFESSDVSIKGNTVISTADNSIGQYNFFALNTDFEGSNPNFEFEVKDGDNYDQIVIGAPSAGAIKVYNIIFTDGIKAGSYRFLNSDPANVNNAYLVLESGLTTDKGYFTNVNPTLNWDAEVHKYSYDMELTTTSSYHDTVDVSGFADEGRQDNLMALNTYRTTYARTFVFNSEADEFVAVSDSGENANLSSLTIRGVSETQGNYSTINYDGHTGFDFSVGSNIIVSDVLFKNATTTGNGAVFNMDGSNSVLSYTNGKVVSNTSAGNGGALFITGNSFMNVEKVDFISNSAESGGAIYIYSTGNGAPFITTIEGDFTGNTASNLGGAIVNYTDFSQGEARSLISVMSGNFTENSVSAVGKDAWGGAIYNTSEIQQMSGDFIGNSAASEDKNAYGGAIANMYIDRGIQKYRGVISNIVSSFKNNYASAENGTALGGAIYTASSMTFNNDGGTMEFSGNYVEDALGKRSNAIFVDTTLDSNVDKTALTFNVSNGGTLNIFDGIDGGNVVDGVVTRGGGTTFNMYITGGENGGNVVIKDVKDYTTGEAVNGIVNANVNIVGLNVKIGSKTFADENTSLRFENSVFSALDGEYVNYEINKLTTINTSEYLLDFRAYKVGDEVKFDYDTITVGPESLGTIRIVDLGIDRDELFEVANYIAKNTEDGYVIKEILTRVPDENGTTGEVWIDLQYEIERNPEYTTIKKDYKTGENQYTVQDNSFIGTIGFALNSTKDSFIIGILTREDPLSAINEFTDEDILTERIFNMTSELYTSKADIGTTAIGSLTVNGNNAAFDISNKKGFLLDDNRTKLTVNNLTMRNAIIAFESVAEDVPATDPSGNPYFNIVLNGVVLTENEEAISNLNGRVKLYNTEISVPDTKQNTIRNDDYIYVTSDSDKSSKLFSSLKNDGLIELSGNTYIGMDEYNLVQISGVGNIQTDDSAIYTDMRFARLVNLAQDGGSNSFTLNSGTLTIGRDTFANSVFTANHGTIDLSMSPDDKMSVIDQPFNIMTYHSDETADANFIIDIDFSSETSPSDVINLGDDSTGVVRILKINGFETIGPNTPVSKSTMNRVIAVLNAPAAVTLDLATALDGHDFYKFYVDWYDYTLTDDFFIGEVHLSATDRGVLVQKDPVYDGIVELNQMSKYPGEVDMGHPRKFILTEPRMSADNEYEVPLNIGKTAPGIYTITACDEIKALGERAYINMKYSDMNFGGFEITTSDKTTLTLDSVVFHNAGTNGRNEYEPIDHSIIQDYTYREEKRGSFIFMDSTNIETTAIVIDSLIQDNSSESYGGAIYSKNNVTIIAENLDTVFAGNMQNANDLSPLGTPNDIYMGVYREQTLNLWARNGHAVRLNSGLETEEGARLTLNINDGSEDSGLVRVVLRKDLGSKAEPIVALNLNGGVFDINDSFMTTIHVTDLTVNENTELNFDIDLQSAQSDKIWTNKDRSNRGQGRILVSADNFKYVDGVKPYVESTKIQLMDLRTETKDFLTFFERDEETGEIIYTDGIVLYEVDDKYIYAKMGLNGCIIVGYDPDCSEDSLVSVLSNTKNTTFKLEEDKVLYNYGSSVYAGIINAKKFNIKGDVYSVISTPTSIEGFLLKDTGNISASKKTLSASNFDMKGFKSAFINNGGKINIKNVNLISNETDGSGGGIRNLAGTVNYNGKKSKYAQAINNVASNFGAVVYNNGTYNSKYVMYGKDKDKKGTYGNNAFVGGAVYTTGKATIKSSIFTDNDAEIMAGALYTEYITSLSSDTFTSNEAPFGGAIYVNALPTSKNKISISKNNFYYNKAGEAGGAVYVEQGKVSISKSNFGSADITQDNGNESQYGGAIYNSTKALEEENDKYNVTTISSSKFVQNDASEGGAIYNAGKLTLKKNSFGLADKSDNHFKNTAIVGGAVYNIGLMTDSSSKFYYNESSDSGGAIYNTGQIVTYNKKNEITGGLNSSKIAYNYASYGGGVYNDNLLGTSKASFTANNAINGGAVYNYTNGDATLISSTFYQNSASGSGGAVYNTGVIRINKSTFGKAPTKTTNYSNIAESHGGAVYNSNLAMISGSKFQYNVATNNGGAVYTNDNSVLSIDNSTFKNNSAEKGGAVYVGKNAFVQISDTSFTNNYADVAGGALYLDEGSTTNIFATKKNVSFSGNTVGDNLESNAIHMENATLNLQAAKGKKITVNDFISGEGTITTSGNVIIKEETAIAEGSDITFNHEGDGTLVFKNEDALKEIRLALAGNSQFSTANNRVRVLSLDTLTLKDDTTANVALDADLKNGTTDKIQAQNVEGTGTLNVSSINLTSNSKSPVVLKVGEDSVVSSVSATSAETAEATYKLKTSMRNGMLTTVAYGQKAKPCTVAAPVAAQLGGYLTQINSYDQAFMNMDISMTKTLAERKAEGVNKYAYSGNNVTYYQNGINQNGKGLWTRPYVTFERVNLHHGPKVSSINYGNFFGGDADIKQLRNGWTRQFSAYVGYNGSTQDYDRQSIDQNGGTIGVTEVWYKNNFFTGLTANVGANAVNASTDLGHENFPMLMAGVASKTGYNFEFKNGKFIIQPSLLLSYSFVHTFSHSNGKGSHVGSSPLNAIQVAPGLKFIFNLPKGWQPYLGINMRWNIMDKTHFSLPDVSIPEMSVDPYVEYGIGVQRKWGERFTGFGQAMIRNGGRNGVMLSFGFKWALGK